MGIRRKRRVGTTGVHCNVEFGRRENNFNLILCFEIIARNMNLVPHLNVDHDNQQINILCASISHSQT